MLELHIVLRLVLVGVFMVAGWTKLRNLAVTRDDFGALGLPVRMIPALSFGLPLFEIGVGLLLLWEPLVSLAAVGALGLLIGFTAVIGMNLWRGRQPSCACFGSLTRTQISARTLIRNVGLMAAATLLLLPLPAAATPIVEISPAAILGMVCLVGIWWVFQLWRQQGRLLLRIEQLERRSTRAAEPQPVSLPRSPDLVGQPVPALALRDVTHRRIDLQSLRGNSVVLIFLDESCQHCRRLLSRLSTWRPSAHAIIMLAGHQPHSLNFAPGLMIVTDDVSNAMQAFGVLGTPTAIVIDATGRVAEPIARGNTSVTQLMDRLTELPQEAQHELAPV
jgi:uncharacterized membrane protein YphA (DoxX/SURF4 family)